MTATTAVDVSVVAETITAPRISDWSSRAFSPIMTWSKSRILGAGKFQSAFAVSLALALAAGPVMADYRRAMAALEAGDVAAATEELRQASEQGDPSALYLLGYMQESGAAGERDYAAAAGSYRRAAEQDHAEAQAALARLYADGRGVARDWPEAARWYAEAAAQGHGPAQNDLAILHANGLGVRRDPERARELLELALQNLPAGAARTQAQLNLQRLNGQSGALQIPDDSGEPAALETEAGPDALPGVSYLADGDAQSAAQDRPPNPQSAMAASLAAAPALAAPADPSHHCVSAALARLSADSGADPDVPDPEVIKRAQELLAGLGYAVGPADGLSGRRTLTAVCRFEIDHNWEPTGRISERLLRSLSLITEARRAGASP